LGFCQEEKGYKKTFVPQGLIALGTKGKLPRYHPNCDEYAATQQESINSHALLRRQPVFSY